MAATTTSMPTEHRHTDQPALRDFRQEVTDNIVGMLECGVAPWQKPLGAGSRFTRHSLQPHQRKSVPWRQRDLFDGHRPATRLRRPQVDDIQAGLRQRMAGTPGRERHAD